MRLMPAGWRVGEAPAYGFRQTAPAQGTDEPGKVDFFVGGSARRDARAFPQSERQHDISPFLTTDISEIREIASQKKGAVDQRSVDRRRAKWQSRRGHRSRRRRLQSPKTQLRKQTAQLQN